MSRRLTALLLLLALLAGCGTAAETAQPEAAEPADENVSGETADVNNGFVAAPSTTSASGSEEKRDLEAEEAADDDLSTLPLDPDYDFDIDSMVPSDFGDFFTESYDGSETTAYLLLPGDSYQLEVTVICGAEDGPTVYVVAGVHGDEEAAWQTGKLLKSVSLKAGTLYIIAPANRWGASKVPMSRYLDSKDLNRSFPGSTSGTNAQRVAYAIYNDIADKQPDFVFDLHEASIVQEGRDFLGSSLIFTDVSLFADLFYDMLWATEDGEICSGAFNYYSPGPDGSINHEVTTGLGIPVLTVETFRGYQMENRISDQLDIVQYALRWYGMID